MSRNVDVSNPEDLSVADRKYLQDRGQLPEGVEPVTDAELNGEAPDDSDQSPAATEDEPYDDMSKADLQAECDARGLPTSGNKDDLVARLVEDDEADEDEE